MKFKQGQAVTLKAGYKPDWTSEEGIIHGYGPKRGEVVHVDFYSQGNDRYCCFVEYPEIWSLDNDRHYYHEEYFEAMVSDEVLEILLESVPQPELV